MRADVPQTVRTKGSIQNERLIDKRPGVWVLRILPAEIGEELAGLDLQVGRQRGGLQIGFFQLDTGLVVLVQLKHDVAEPLEVRVNRAINGDFGEGDTILAEVSEDGAGLQFTKLTPVTV